MITWVFLITLAMPSFGGPVLVRAELTSEAACQKFRKVAVQQLENMRSTAVVSECVQLVRP